MLAGGGTIQLSPGDYHFANPAWSGCPTCFNFNIQITASDLILAGAPVAPGAEPTTRFFFGNGDGTTARGNVVGLSLSGNRLLIRNITIDWDILTHIPGTVNDLAPATCSTLTSATWPPA